MTKRVALISGVTGQDGAYLAELLLKKGYVVHGIKRRSSSFNTGRVDHLYQDQHERDLRFTLHYGDLTDATNLIRIVQETQPDEIYNLAAQSHVQVSFETPCRPGGRRRSSTPRPKCAAKPALRWPRPLEPRRGSRRWPAKRAPQSAAGERWACCPIRWGDRRRDSWAYPAG